MADGYGSGISNPNRSRSSGGYGSGISSVPTTTTTTKKKKKQLSFFSGIDALLGPLARDIQETVLGLPGGLYQVGRGLGEAAQYGASGGRRGSYKRIAGIGKGIGESYAHTYGPLFEGDPMLTLGRIKEHPLGPILDVATAASLGLGGAVRGTSMLSKAGLVGKNVPSFLRPAPRSRTLASPRITEGMERGGVFGGPYQTLPVTGGELSRRIKLGADAALKRLPPDMRVLGEWARYSKAVERQLRKSQAGGLLKVLPWYKISQKLSKEEGIALTLRVQFPTEGLLNSYKQFLKKAKETEDVRLAAKPGKRRIDVPDQPYLDLLDNPKVMKYFREPSQEMMKAREIAQAMDEVFVNDLVRAGVLARDQAEWIRWEPSLVALGAKYKNISEADAIAAGIPLKLAEARGFKILEAPEGMTIDDMIRSIKTEIESKGGQAPMYYPHVAELKDIRVPRVGGGMVVPKSPVEMRSGVLESAGRMILDPNVWTMKFLENTKFLYYNEKHSNLIIAAVPVDDLPNSNWRYITRKNERIQQLERTSATFEEYLDNVKKELGEDPFAAIGKQGTVDDLLTGNADEAAVAANGKRLALPKPVANKIIGDYTRSHNAAVRLLRDVTTVWRALVLNLRVGWLTNNIVGNTFLYAIKNAGPEGLRSYVRAVGDAAGGLPVVRRLWNDKLVRSRLTAADIIELFPEQYIGTFFGTQIPTYGRIASSKAFVGKYAPTRMLREVDIAYEQALRRAMLNKLVKKSPEFKKVWDEMPKQTKTIRAAERKALHNNPRLVKQVSQEVNDALGDFFNLSDFERRVLRGTMPFYAWYRAITAVMLKLPLDSPVRANILLQMGRIGDEMAADDYGLYLLKGGIGGKTRLGTKAANPFSTPVDIGRGLAAGFLGAGTREDVQNLTGLINPIISEPMFSLERAARGESYTGLPPFLEAPYEIVRGLPLATLGWPYESKLYEEDDRLNALLRYLGIPIRTPIESEARKRANR